MKNPEQLIAADIYRHIKSDILSLQIKDGDFLTLTELSRKYGVSKTPVRDALGILEKEGYLRSLPRKGYLFIPATTEHTRECFQLRLILEGASARLAAQAADMPEFEGIMELARQFPAGETEDVGLFNKMNSAFHLAIVRAAHNAMMLDIYSGIMEKLSRILLADTHNLQMPHERDEHVAIAEALSARDAALAESLIGDHIRSLQNRVFRSA